MKQYTSHVTGNSSRFGFAVLTLIAALALSSGGCSKRSTLSSAENAPTAVGPAAGTPIDRPIPADVSPEVRAQAEAQRQRSMQYGQQERAARAAQAAAQGNK